MQVRIHAFVFSLLLAALPLSAEDAPASRSAATITDKPGTIEHAYFRNVTAAQPPACERRYAGEFPIDVR